MRAGADLFEWVEPPEPIEPERPHVLTVEQWRSTNGPNYKGILVWRLQQLDKLRNSIAKTYIENLQRIERGQKPVPSLLDAAKVYYRKRPDEFIMDWCDTYDPRRSGMKWVPFVMFQRQGEFITFLSELYDDQENGLVEKSRDMGLTWLCVAWSVWAWLFVPGIAIGWGSRKQELVDKKGDPDSIFEKLRMLIDRLPDIFLPEGFDRKVHSTSMKIENPVTGATITGEIGDNIGRGGRKSIYFKDEAAHYEHPELIEASLGDNTNCQIDISSVNGMGNVFHRRAEMAELWTPGAKIESGKVRKFIVAWQEHPEKTQEWYNKRRARMESEGLLAKFLQEVERDYSGSLAGVIILREWVEASVDAHNKLSHWKDSKGVPIDFLSGAFGAALDVADSDDGDRNALVVRKGILLFEAEERGGARDVGATTRWAIATLLAGNYGGIECQYDSVGMGSAVKSEYNRLTLDDKTLDTSKVALTAWNAGDSVQDPYFNVVPDDDETPLNKDFFGNMKAQAWWSLKMRFFRTWQAVTQGIRLDPDTLISLDSGLRLLATIKKELCQPVMIQNSALKQIVDKKPDGTRSPNIADAIVMCYFPVDNGGATAAVGTHGSGKAH